MRSNTAEVGNQPVKFHSCSVENRKSDPFTIVEGHYPVSISESPVTLWNSTIPNRHKESDAGLSS